LDGARDHVLYGLRAAVSETAPVICANPSGDASTFSGQTFGFAVARVTRRDSLFLMHVTSAPVVSNGEVVEGFAVYTLGPWAKSSTSRSACPAPVGADTPKRLF